MNIVIIEHNSDTRTALCQLLQEEGGFEKLEVFSSETDAIEQAHWKNIDMLLTPALHLNSPGKKLQEWVKKVHPHITSISHSLGENGTMSYSTVY